MTSSSLQIWLQLDSAMLFQVVEFVKSEKYARFTRIIFDTAPTGHTLRLLSVPDFVEKSLSKIIRLRKKLSSAGSGLRGLFGASEQQDTAVERLEKLRVHTLQQAKKAPLPLGMCPAIPFLSVTRKLPGSRCTVNVCSSVMGICRRSTRQHDFLLAGERAPGA
jgi:hypothetical protein